MASVQGPEEIDHTGVVAGELERWHSRRPGDQSLVNTAYFIGSLVAGWRSGDLDERTVLHRMVDFYHDIDGNVSEAASAAASQAIMWFEIETGVPDEVSKEVNKRLLEDI